METLFALLPPFTEEQTDHWQIHLTIKGPIVRIWRFLAVILAKLMNKQSRCQWFETSWRSCDVTVIQYIPRNMHTAFALLCFAVVIHWLIFPYPSGLLHWHCGNLAIAPVPAKQPWWIWINTSCEFIMNDCITTTKQSTTKPCAYFLGYTVMAADMLTTQGLREAAMIWT